MRPWSSRSIALGVLVLSASLCASSVAGAAQIEQPTTNPFVVALDSAMHPVAFTIAASGFGAGHQVFVEQCDGVNPSTPNWDPSIDCDSGSSPAPVVAGADGRAGFDATNANHRFLPFVGLSPQGQFSCLAHGAAATGASVPSYATCYVRVSSNNAAATSDQTLFAITLPAGAVPPPATTPPTTGPASATTSSVAGATTSSTTKGGPRSPTTSTRASSTKKSTSTTSAAAASTAFGPAGGGAGSSSSASSVGWIIATIVAASGGGGYLWAVRRRRAATSRRRRAV